MRHFGFGLIALGIAAVGYAGFDYFFATESPGVSITGPQTLEGAYVGTNQVRYTIENRSAEPARIVGWVNHC